eukprot:scaffold23658_cov61-Phaeocystis_antarctica.AAC.6
MTNQTEAPARVPPRADGVSGSSAWSPSSAPRARSSAVAGYRPGVVQTSGSPQMQTPCRPPRKREAARAQPSCAPPRRGTPASAAAVPCASPSRTSRAQASTLVRGGAGSAR